MSKMTMRSSLLVAFLGIPIVAFLAGRLRVFSLAYFNAPGRMPLYENFTASDIKFGDRIRNCEDTLLIESHQLALLACDPGRETWNAFMGLFLDDENERRNAELWVFNYSAEPNLPPHSEETLKRIRVVGFDDNKALRTVGIELHEPSMTLLCTNVGPAGPSIEQFRLDLAALTATHQRTLKHPAIRSPNSIVALSDTEFFFTNQHHFTVRESGKFLWALETYGGLPLGSVVHARVITSEEGGGVEKGHVTSLDAAVVLRQAYPNGIALLNETTLAVSSTNQRLVYLYTTRPLGSGGSTTTTTSKQLHPTLDLASSIWLPFLPDNLSVSKSDGALLIAGHPHLPSLNKFASTRRVCRTPDALAQGGGTARSMCDAAQAASWAGEWTPDGGLRHIYGGWRYPTSASVVRDRERAVGIISGLYGQGIMVWQD